MTAASGDFQLWFEPDGEASRWCITLMPERCAFDSASGTLLVADLHLGKAAVFRSRGLPVPRGTTTATLARLSQALHRTSAQRLVVLGDLLHAKESHAAPTLLALKNWRSQHPLLECWAVEGNHDRHAGALPPEFEFRTAPSFGMEPWLGVHDAQHGVDASLAAPRLVVAGHVHPVVRLKSSVDAFRLPCFSLYQRVLTLPAFGEFTGGHAVSRRAHDPHRVFAVADSVVEVP